MSLTKYGDLPEVELPQPFRVPKEVRWKPPGVIRRPGSESGNDLPKTIVKSCSRGTYGFSSDTRGGKAREGLNGRAEAGSRIPAIERIAWIPVNQTTRTVQKPG